MDIINQLKRKIGVLMIENGIATMRNSENDYVTVDAMNVKINGALSSVLPQLQISELDGTYRFTDWNTWQDIIATLSPIFKQFPWTAEVFDCDDRSNLMTSLCSIIYQINTCTSVYCQVYDVTTGILKYLHYANLIIDKDNNVYLLDLDNGQQFTKVTSNNPVIGNCKYNLLSIRAY